MGFVVSLNHRVKMKENEKMDKYSDLARELKKKKTTKNPKKLWNVKVTLIPIVVCELGTVLKGSEKRVGGGLEIRKRIETI